MNLFDDALRAQVRQVQKDLFDSFKRTESIRFYKKAKEVYVYDPQYSADFDERFNQNIKTEDFQDFPVCLTYLDRQILDNYLGGEDTGIRFNAMYNRVRIQVEADAFEYLKDTERFIFGEEKFIAEDGWRKLGLLESFGIFEINLQRVV